MKKLTDDITISDISKQVAAELEISELDSEIICRSQFKFSSELIQSDDYSTIMFMYIGKITLNKKHADSGRFLSKKHYINGSRKYPNWIL